MPLYWQYDKALSDAKPARTAALRQGDWKLLADAKMEAFALYNLKDDIGEKADRAGDKAQADRLKAMKAEMARLHGQINAGAVRR